MFVTNHWMTFILMATALYQFRRIDLSDRRARLAYMALVGTAVLATVRNPVVALAIDRSLGLPDVAHLLEYSSGIVAVVAWGILSLPNVSPTGQGRRRWLLWLSPLVFMMLLLVWWEAVLHRHPIVDYFDGERTNHSLALTVIAHAYLIVVLGGIGIPATWRVWRSQTGPVSRLRFAALIVIQLVACGLSSSIVVLHSLMIFDVLPRGYQSQFVHLLIVALSLAYGVAVFPARFYSAAVLLQQYQRNIMRFMTIRRLEGRISALLGAPGYPLAAYEVIWLPDLAQVHTVVSIVDRHRSLLSSGNPAAGEMARRLGSAIEQHAGYEDLVCRLCALEKQLEV